MKTKKVSGLFLVVALVMCCLIMLVTPRRDYYSLVLHLPKFETFTLEDYSGNTGNLLEYVPKGEGDVTVWVKENISLEPGDYEMEISYSATDDSSFLKVAAPDYIFEDNTSGKVFAYQQLSPDESIIRFNFSLDQKVDSLYLSVETKDPDFACGRWNLASVHPIWNDNALYIVMTLLLGAVLLYLFNSKPKQRPTCIILAQKCNAKQQRMIMFLIAVFVLFVTSIPLFNDTFLIGHDTMFHTARIEGISRGLQSGQFPVRVHGGVLNDYGYPNSLFYPELLLYIPALIHLAGVSLLTSFRVLVFLINVITLVCAYTAFKRFTNSRFLGMSMAVLYMLNPYRMLCLYYRSAIGEVIALAFLPLVFYGLYAIFHGKKQDWWLLVVGATGVLQAHILTTQLTAIFAAIFVLANIKSLFQSEKRWKELLYATAFTVLINVWFLLPMIMMIVQLSPAVFDRPKTVLTELSLNHLFNTGKLFVMGPHPVGWIALLSVPIYLLTRTLKPKTEANATLYKVGDFLVACGVLFSIGTTSFLPWISIVKIPVLGTMLGSIQFAYRLLSIAELCFYFLLAINTLLWMSNVKVVKAIAIQFMVMAVIFTGILYEFGMELNTGRILNKSEHNTELDISGIVGMGEYVVQGAQIDDMVTKPPVLESTNSTFAVSQLKRYGTKTSFHYEMDLAADGENWIIVPMTYIPNYVVKVDGQPVPTVNYEDAKVAFQAPQPQGDVSVMYQEPTTFRVFELVSVVSLIGFIYVKKRPLSFKTSKKK